MVIVFSTIFYAAVLSQHLMHFVTVKPSGTLGIAKKLNGLLVEEYIGLDNYPPQVSPIVQLWKQPIMKLKLKRSVHEYATDPR